MDFLRPFLVFIAMSGRYTLAADPKNCTNLTTALRHGLGLGPENGLYLTAAEGLALLGLVPQYADPGLAIFYTIAITRAIIFRREHNYPDEDYLGADFFLWLPILSHPVVQIQHNLFPQDFFTVRADWMGSLFLDNRMKLNAFSLPGTHDTMSRYGGPIPWTQSLPLHTQLEYGIRALDIRCSTPKVFPDDGESVYIYHGFWYQEATLRDVLRICADFLAHHYTEVIVMRISDDSGGRQLTKRIRELLDEYSNYIYNGTSMPLLGAVRGKIVVLNDFVKGGFIPYSGGYVSNVSNVIQDKWEITEDFTIDNKWDAVLEQLKNASQSPSYSQIFHINYLSGAAPTLSDLLSMDYVPIRVASEINSRFITQLELSQYLYRKIGIIMMDYPRDKQIEQIISMNNKFRFSKPLNK